ncbi:hypothetical protein A8B82_21195 [Sulfitobacter sp. EhC04]|uniref:hypothetical protein n=1 Tax=Sulfitobacter sp. EhC04 TaxID=1849168 RepID=UPI0007F4A7A2|nr:hypothetical protein [Sulfitobacter sp. EhC04]OAN71111.1 hypothetical protein A8B82_21195 [Sulfitobacter sp. EhC04]
MSSHSVKAMRRHPEPSKLKRERFPVGHVSFQIIDHPEHGVTFSLRPDGEAFQDKPALFSAHVEPGMADQLRKLAHRLDELEDRINTGD